MHRIDGAGHVNGLFVAEDVATNRPPTEITPAVMNAFQEEMATLIEWAGLALNKADNTQLRQALLAKFVAAASVQGQTYTAFTTTGVTGAFVLTPVPAIAAYAASQRFRAKFHVAGNGADTINVSALGNKALKQYDSSGMKVAAVITANQLVDVEYDGVDFVLLDPLPSPDKAVNAGGTADAITATYFPAVAALTNGLTLYVRPGAANATTAPTFSPNGLVAATIVKGANVALAVGDIAGAGHWLELNYDSALAKWVLQNPATGISSSISQASAAEILAESAVAKFISPDRLKSSARTVRAWVNFAGASGAINASFNVASVTRNSTGNYTVNFSTALADANYFGAGIAGAGDTNTSSSAVREFNGGVKTTTAYQIATIGGASASLNFTDFTRAGMAVFGN